MKMSKRTWATVGVVLLALSSAALIVLRQKMLRVPQERFQAKGWRSQAASASGEGRGVSNRQRMMRDLILNVLPGKNREEIERLLGSSPTPKEMRRYSAADLQVRKQDEKGGYQPFPRTGQGHYFDEFQWDLIYPIGVERTFIFDHKGQEFSPDEEYLIIRLDSRGLFQSWFVAGSERWPEVVGGAGMRMYRRSRAAGGT